MKYLVLFYENDKPAGILESRYYADEPSDNDVENVMKEVSSSFAQVYYDKYESEEYDELISEHSL